MLSKTCISLDSIFFNTNLANCIIFILYFVTSNVIFEIFLQRVKKSILYKFLFALQKINFLFYCAKFIFSYLKIDFLYQYQNFIYKILTRRYWIEGDKAPVCVPHYVIHHSLSNSFWINVFFNVGQLDDVFFRSFGGCFDTILKKNSLYECLIPFCLFFISCCIWFVVQKKYIVNFPILSKSLIMLLGNSPKKNNDVPSVSGEEDFDLLDMQIDLKN